MVPYSMQHFITTWLLLLPYLQRSSRARYVVIFVLKSSTTTNIVTFSQCILLCRLEINNRHHSLDMNIIPPKSFPPGQTYSVTIVVVVTVMHNLTPRVMLWLTCTNILWEYVVTNIVVVIDVVCIVVVVVMSLHLRPTSAIWHSRHEGITNRCSGPN